MPKNLRENRRQINRTTTVANVTEALMRWCAELSTQVDGPKVRRFLAPSISQQLVHYKINVCYSFPVILYH